MDFPTGRRWFSLAAMILFLSALAITLLTAMAWAMGFRSRPVLDELSACAEADGRIAGFRAAGAALADDGHGALVRGLDGRLVLILPLGDGWVTRLIPPQTKVQLSGSALEFRLAEPMLRSAKLPMAARPRWVEEALA